MELVPFRSLGIVGLILVINPLRSRHFFSNREVPKREFLLLGDVDG